MFPLRAESWEDESPPVCLSVFTDLNTSTYYYYAMLNFLIYKQKLKLTKHHKNHIFTKTLAA